MVTEKERARIDILACKRLGETFPHTLLFGMGGCGKTFFARAIAEELGYFFVEKEAASLRSREDILELLIESNERSLGCTLLLFVDEIHRLTSRQQEVFYFPMTEWKVDQGDDHWYEMRPFTLIGATTQIERLDEHSFQKRFHNIWELKPYPETFMLRIVAGMLLKQGLQWEHYQLLSVVRVCGGIPRVASHLCKKIRNHCVAHDRRHITDKDLRRVFVLEGLTRPIK